MAEAGSHFSPISWKGTINAAIPLAGVGGYAVLRLPSGEQRRVLEKCVATIGAISNPQHKNRKLGKAGAARWSGRRPTVSTNPSVQILSPGAREAGAVCWCRAK